VAPNIVVITIIQQGKSENVAGEEEHCGHGDRTEMRDLICIDLHGGAGKRMFLVVQAMGAQNGYQWGSPGP
jgi:hypothetical protein